MLNPAVLPASPAPQVTTDESPEVPVVTDDVFADIAESIHLDCFSQPDGPSRAFVTEELSKFHTLWEKLGHKARPKRFRPVRHETPAARPRLEQSPSHATGE